MNKREHHVICAIYADVLMHYMNSADTITQKDLERYVIALEYIIPPCDRTRIRQAEHLALEIRSQL